MSASRSPFGEPADDAEIDVAVWREGDTTVIGLSGEHDQDTASGLTLVFSRICGLGGSGGVVVDLSQVVFLDSSILAGFVAGRELVLGQGRTFVLRAPSPQAQRVLEMCGLVWLVEPTTTAREGESHPRMGKIEALADGPPRAS